jgi:cytochrome c-type biogenesis protein CcmH
MAKKLKILFVALGIAAATTAFFIATPQKTPSINERANKLYSEIRCPVCSGLNIAQSSSPIAKDLRTYIVNELKKGESDNQIISQLENSYGSSIIFSPPDTGLNALIWIIPLVLFVVSVIGFLTYYALRKKKPKSHSLSLKSRVALLASALLCFLSAGVYLILLALGVNLPGKSSNVSVSSELSSARILASTGNVKSALAIYQAILNGDPSQPEALSDEGYLISQVGISTNRNDLVSEGKNEILKSISVNPSLNISYLYLGTIYLNGYSDPKDAVKEFSIFLANNPPSILLQSAKPVILEAYQRANLPAPKAVSG